MNNSTSNPGGHRRPTTAFATSDPPPSNNANAKVHDINYILGPSSDRPPPVSRPEPAIPQTSATPATRPEDASTAASHLTDFSHAPRQSEPDGSQIQYTPTTHRISKAKKGKKVHVCEFGCGKVFTRAEHRKRHEANHRPEPLYKCHVEGCNKPFQRLDLLNRHLERQHGIGPATADTVSTEPKATDTTMLPPPKRSHSSTASGKNDWNAHKNTIEQLYITENKPLKDIKVFMEEHYGFTPVEDRAYEKAFRRLGLSKNIPSSTMEAILAAIEKRKQGGKDTTVYWRGQRVDEKRIHRFKQRLARENKLDPSEFTGENARTFDLPEHVRCETPNGINPTLPPSGDQNSPLSSDGSGDSSSEDDVEERPGKRYACTSCGEKFSFAGHLSRHAEAHGQQEERHECPAPGCPYQEQLGFKSRQLLWDHMVSEHKMG